MFDGGSSFMQRFSALAATGSGAGSNPQGGGADPVAERRYRTWFESYGMRSTTDAQGVFPGNSRKTYGAVAGAGMTLAPGANVGLSVDRGQTMIAANGAPQSGRLDLTQIGLLGSYDSGPWSFNATVVYGAGEFHTTRFDGVDNSIAAYRSTLWAAMAEIGYYVSLPNNSRFVPRFNVEWMRSHTNGFTETGGDAPIASSAVNASRFRLMAGGEIGHSWLIDRRVMDISAYGRFVDNVSQRIDDAQVTLAAVPGDVLLVAGVRESRYGADAGVALSGKVTDLMRLYILYDARLRGNMTVHGGTVGAEFRF